MSNFRPLVSIIIPVYNGSNYLREAIDSALAQTYENIEVLVINDGSNDQGATEKIAKSYGDKIRYLAKENGGVATALNLGIKEMKGDYLSWLSHDDLYEPEKIAKQIEFLSRQTNKNIVIYADYELINEKSEHVETHIQDHDMLEKIPIYSLLRGIINGITLLIPKVVFETHGVFDVTLRCTQDYDLWFRIFNDYKFVHQPEVYTKTRIHPNQDTASNPAAVTEGNALWIRMLKTVPDSVKRDAEGNLFGFYLEMVRFIQHTPYKETTKFCSEELAKYAGLDKEVNALDYSSAEGILRAANEMADMGQKVASQRFIATVVGQLVGKRVRNDIAARVVSTYLSGDAVSVTPEYINQHYLPKFKKSVTKKRIMFCSGHWLTGGMERVMTTLFEELRASYDIFLITPFDDRQSMIQLPNYVTHIRISDKKFYDSFDTVSLKYAILFKIDVVIGFMNLLDKQLELYNLCRDVGIKTIASNHEIYFYPYVDFNFHNIVKPRIDAFQNANAVLWLTNFSAAAYGLVGKNSYLMPNPNGFDIQDDDSKRDEKIILAVGRFDDYIKRIDRILLCFAEVSERVPNAKLVLVGRYNRTSPIRRGGRVSVNDLIKINNIDESRIEFVGEVNDLASYYRKASMLLLTSLNEGFGMVINEAACFGVPTVCNRIPGLEDLVVDGHNGKIVEQDDIEAMVDAACAILGDDEERERLGRNAKQYVKKFDRKMIGDSWKYLLETLIKNMDRSDEQSALRKRLSYHIPDYRAYGALLLDEMHKMIKSSFDGADARKLDFMNNQPRYIRRIMKVRRAVELEGVRRTAIIAAKKIAKKARLVK